MVAQTVEERLTRLEQELTQIKQKMQAEENQQTEPAWKQIVGVFKDCPEFEEAVRLGREWRESQRMEYDDDEPSLENGPVAAA